MMRFHPIQRLPRFCRPFAFLALAACAVLGGTATTCAQSVVVNFYMGLGSPYDITGALSDYTSKGFRAGDIVQVVAVNSSFAGAGTYGGSLSTTDPIRKLAEDLGQSPDAYQKMDGTGSAQEATYFDSTFGGEGPPYDPYSVGEGQKIVQTTTLQGFGADPDNPDYFGVSTFINYTSLAAQGYDGIYIRVFAADKFEEGEATTIYWGASSVYNFQYGSGTEEAYFGGVQTMETTFEVIPEPGTAALLGTGAAVAWLGRRRRKKVQANA